MQDYFKAEFKSSPLDTKLNNRRANMQRHENYLKMLNSSDKTGKKKVAVISPQWKNACSINKKKQEMDQLFQI